jgi:branched-chain amino acid transport system ATP-binding protein
MSDHMGVATNPEVVLACRGVSAGYGPITVIRDIDLEVRKGEVVAIIGPNGAGKTSTLLTLAGELTPSAGSVELLGRTTTDPMHVRCRNGLGFVTEERSVIMDLSARDNLRLANVSDADAIGLFPELERLLGRKAGLLSGGEQQMLTLARVLGRKSQVILADELSLGLAPIIVTRLLTALRAAADERGLGVLLVEQHVRQALKVADRVYVMQRGKIVLSGTAVDIQSRLSEIEAAYLSSAV